MARNIKEVKKLIYTTLTGDGTLTSLLGESESVYSGFPDKNNIKYPAIFYRILNEEAYPYNEDVESSELDMVTFEIMISDSNRSEENSDSILNRIDTLFNGQYLSSSTVIFKKACKRTVFLQFFNEDVELWNTVIRYETVTAPI